MATLATKSSLAKLQYLRSHGLFWSIVQNSRVASATSSSRSSTSSSVSGSEACEYYIALPLRNAFGLLGHLITVCLWTPKKELIIEVISSPGETATRLGRYSRTLRVRPNSILCSERRVRHSVFRVCLHSQQSSIDVTPRSDFTLLHDCPSDLSRTMTST